MTISISQISVGIGLRINGDIMIVTEWQHVKPGKGGAFARSKLKNVRTHQVLEKTFRPGDKLDDVDLEERKLQNLYRSDDVIHFMDYSSYEEIEVNIDILGNDIRFLQDNLEVDALVHDDKVLKITLPIFIESEIIHTEPGFKGDSSRAGNKPATIDTEAVIQVPLFVEMGEVVKIDTRTGEYVERVKK